MSLLARIQTLFTYLLTFIFLGSLRIQFKMSVHLKNHNHLCKSKVHFLYPTGFYSILVWVDLQYFKFILKLHVSNPLLKEKNSFFQFYYMATIVHALWLAAERALFSCNDRALWNFFSVQRLFWVVSKTTCAWAKTTEKMDKVQLYFQ